MRIALLQYSPLLGRISHNRKAVDILLENARRAGKLKTPPSLFVFPEMALTGYAFESLKAITPLLEEVGEGCSTQLALDTARDTQAGLTVIGYPEIDRAQQLNFNSAMVFEKDILVYNYRKKHLYETDETWAQEGQTFGFFESSALFPDDNRKLKIGLGICMDLNPRQFNAPYDAYEFGTHCVEKRVDVIILSMAWLRFEGLNNKDPLEAVRYWLGRLGPVLEASWRTIFVVCNRTGAEGATVYHGHSAVVLLDNGHLTLVGSMGREEGVLEVEVDYAL